MHIVVELSWLLTVLLVATRLGVVLYMTRIYSFAPIPETVKILFAMALAVILVGALDIGLVWNPSSIEDVLAAVLGELVMGAVLAFGVQTAFGAYLWGGRILDLQMGFGVANLIDPSTQTQAPMIGMLLALAALAVFFALDVHHLLLKGLAISFQSVPPGTWLKDTPANAIMAQLGFMFSTGFALVAPVVMALLLIDLVVAFAAKTMPQLNVFFIILPIKILAGLIILTVSLRYFDAIHERVFSSIFDFWGKVLG